MDDNEDHEKTTKNKAWGMQWDGEKDALPTASCLLRQSFDRLTQLDCHLLQSAISSVREVDMCRIYTKGVITTKDVRVWGWIRKKDVHIQQSCTINDDFVFQIEAQEWWFLGN